MGTKDNDRKEIKTLEEMTKDEVWDEFADQLKNAGADIEASKAILDNVKRFNKKANLIKYIEKYDSIGWEKAVKYYKLPLVGGEKEEREEGDEQSTQLAPLPKGKIKPRDTPREEIIPKGKTYKVHGKTVGDSALVQEVANKESISSEIRDIHEDDTMFRVVVRSSLPTGQYIDVCMVINYEDEARLEALKNIRSKMTQLMNLKGVDKGDKLNEEFLEYTSSSYFKMLVEIRRLEIKKFASRTATTKARRQGAVWLLSGDPREKGEIDFEDKDNEVANRKRLK